MESNELTPIEEYKDILLKRDDKFVLDNINGGKLRQAIYLIKSNLEVIKTKHNSSVVCSVSLKNPQSAIISSVCKAYGLTCNIISYKTIQPNRNLSMAQENKANIYGFKVGHTNVLEAYAKKYFPNDYFINMGFLNDNIFDANSEQVKNLPDELDYLVIPVGSAINFISILQGLVKYKKLLLRPKNIIGIYVGKKPFKLLSKFNFNLFGIKYKMIQSHYKYSEEVNIDNYFLDPIYEAKAYDWLIKNLDVKNNKVLLWVIGKRNMDFKMQVINYLGI
jgi:1-aminocyclopropane-1-carboxylate deaminase/D-cysteine desulfhydrase-like pyridoxal-dependent ACC family enzyme